MQPLSDREREFIAANPTAAMITVADGVAKPVRVSVALLDGALVSSATADRVRTRRLRTDPRCTLFVFGAGWQWLALESTVVFREDEDAIAAHVPLFRDMQHKPTGPLTWFGRELEEDEFLDTMRAEHRLLFEFQINRSYGMF
jgi:hypothetical protein